MDLQAKIIDHFEGRVVRKDLASIVKGNLPVPTYVVEYLLAQYCATDDEQMIKEGVDKVKEIIRNNYVHRADSQKIQWKIRDHGRYTIIDKVNVELNDKKQNQYEATFANLGIAGIPVSDEIVKLNPKLLSGNGVWCILIMEYNHSDTVKIRWEIDDLKPIQISAVDLNDYISKRKEFTTDEWIDLLVHSVGLMPDQLNKRDKLIQLSRLLPHLENNFNFIELGPKGTGKSHVFQELSPHGVLVSGGDVTSARLFVKYSGNKEILGLVGYWDIIAWDEFEHQSGKRVDPSMIDIMQNYLANKSFNRGKGSHEASASMAFIGNTKHTVPYMLKNSHLFESIPEAFIKGAFLDRIHTFNPGWEVRVLKKSSFSNKLGFITDYLAEILHELRNYDFSPIMGEYVKLDSSLSERDHMGIRKTFSGMMKLIYPDKNITREETFELIDFAVEGRKRVKDQLYIIDETFKLDSAEFKYKVLSTGKEVSVETLECLNLPKKKVVVADTEEDIEVAEELARRPRIKQVKKSIKNINVRENQTGISYELLFSDYLDGASEVTIEDPFIRYPYQVRNLVELLSLIIKLNNDEKTIKVHLTTNNDEDKIPDSIDAFDEIIDSLSDTSIEFTYEFKDFHDRKITTDTGWEIILGRGLDIFEKRNGFTIEDYVQEKRRCKDFNVTYIPEVIEN